MQAEQIEQIIAAAVPDGLKGSLYSLSRADGYESKLLWAWAPSPEQMSEARKNTYPLAKAYLFSLEYYPGESGGSRPIMESYYDRDGWRMEGNAPYVLQLLKEAEALRTQVAEQAAEIERLRAELAADDEADMIAAAEAQRRLDDPTDEVVSFEEVVAGLGVQDA